MALCFCIIKKQYTFTVMDTFPNNFSSHYCQEVLLKNIRKYVYEEYTNALEKLDCPNYCIIYLTSLDHNGAQKIVSEILERFDYIGQVAHPEADTDKEQGIKAVPGFLTYRGPVTQSRLIDGRKIKLVLESETRIKRKIKRINKSTKLEHYAGIYIIPLEKTFMENMEKYVFPANDLNLPKMRICHSD